MITLQRGIDLFLGDYKPSTRRAYAGVLQPLADYVGPARPLDKIGVEHVQEYIQQFAARGIAPATYNKHVKSLRTFFNWCIRAGYVAAPGPAVMLKRKPVDKFVSRDKAMPDHVYDQVVAFAKWDARALALVLFLGDTGARIGGAATLRWPAVDFEKQMATVTQKGEKTGPVFFGEDCAEAFKRWRLVATLENGDYVFSLKGGAIKPGNLGQYFRRITQRAGVGSYGPHSLRHRFGHHAADRKEIDTVVSQAMHHSSTQTTKESYYPKDWERVEEMVKDMAYKLDKKPSKIIRFRSSK